MATRRRGLRSPAGCLVVTGVGGAVAKRPILADIDELAIKTAPPTGRLQDGHGAVERPCGGESWSLWIYSGATSLLAISVVPHLPPHRALLGDDNPRARGTTLTASSKVVEEAAPRLLDRRWQLLLDGEAVAARRRLWCVHAAVPAALWGHRLLRAPASALDATVFHKYGSTALNHLFRF